MNWLVLAIVAAILFGVSPLFMKSGIRKTSAYVGATVWSTVMMIVAIITVAREHSASSLSNFSPLRLLFLLLAGAALGATILFLFRALKDGEAIKVVPIMAFEYFVYYILNKILARSMPSIPRIVVLILILVCVILMASKSKGRGGSRWLLYSILSVVCLVLSKYLMAHHVGSMNTSFKRLCLFIIATVIGWIVTLATGTLKSIRNMSFLEGIYLIISVLCLWAAYIMASRSIAAYEPMGLSIILFGSLIATLVFACVFMKDKITTQYFLGLIFFEFLVTLWLGYIPVLSAML